MPGGSVNGRPFRESSDSYQKSGIPCGNPKRFQSKDVMRMGDVGHGITSKRRPLSGPVEDIETEGQRQLQELLKKQLDTDVTYHQQISQRRQFHKSSAFVPEADQLSGVTDLSQFKDIERRDAYIEELKHCGLTEDEINLKLIQDQINEKDVKKRKYGEDPLSYKEKLEEIDKKIQKRQNRLNHPDSFFGRKNLSRHEMELEQSLIKDNDQSKLLTGMLTTMQKDPSLHPDDPMNNLPEILKSVTKVTKEGKRAKRKMKQEMVKLCLCEKEFMGDIQNSEDDEKQRTHIEAKESGSHSVDDFDDLNSDKLICNEKCTPDTQGKTDKCVRLNVSLETENKAETKAILSEARNSTECTSRQIQGHIISLSEDEIVKNRLTLEEIKQLPRFENYSTGDPSNVLYLKNLSNKVTEEDLVSLFIRFEESKEQKIIFRLLTGRMKGQAFITFKDSNVAKTALELANGYKLKGKPLIIQYGRKSS